MESADNESTLGMIRQFTPTNSKGKPFAVTAESIREPSSATSDFSKRPGRRVSRDLRISTSMESERVRRRRYAQKTRETPVQLGQVGFNAINPRLLGGEGCYCCRETFPRESLNLAGQVRTGTRESVRRGRGLAKPPGILQGV